MNRSILLVDDERQILKALHRLFMDEGYDIYTAENGEAALDILDKENIDLVVSDMRMPNMDGYQLLKKVKEKHPNSLRIILSGYADETVVFKAIQQNLAKIYMFKPWDNQSLLATVRSIFSTGDVLNEKGLLLAINNLQELPVLPDTYRKLMLLIENDADLKKVAEIVEEDISLATKVLHVANSAFFGMKSGSISQAIVYLGLTNIKNLLLASVMFDDALMDKGGSIIKKNLWKHSCQTNSYMVTLHDKLLKKAIPAEYMSAGLLHDIGKVILLDNYKGKYLNLLRKEENKENKCLHDLEKEEFNISHEEIGGYLLNWWEFPLPLIECALYHNNPTSEKIVNKELLAVIHIANYLSLMQQNPNAVRHFEPDVLNMFGTTLQECEQAVKEAMRN